jgi:hypothetical protein
MLAGQLCGGKITLVDHNDKAEAFQKNVISKGLEFQLLFCSI